MASVIGTWNLENLFRPGESAGPSSDSAYDEKLTALATTIEQIAPDVLAVQEVGDPDALDDLVERLEGTWHVELADPDRRGIRVGFLSRSELTEVEQHANFPDGVSAVQLNDEGETASRLGRPLLKATVDLGGSDPLTLVTCHVKSKLLTYPGNRFSPRDEDERARYALYALGLRAAEAATVRSYATTLLDGAGDQRALAVMGDLNDGVHSATTTMLVGPPGSEIGTAGFERSDKGDPMRLWNLAPLIAEDRRFTRTYEGRPEMIDHILASHALVERIDTADTVDAGGGSVTDFPSERRDAAPSDHRPVIAEIRTT